MDIAIEFSEDSESADVIMSGTTVGEVQIVVFNADDAAPSVAEVAGKNTFGEHEYSGE